MGEFLISQKINENDSSSKERLDLCLSAGNLAWWEMDVKTGKIVFNENKVKMLGYKLSDFKDVDYNAFTDLVHPDDYDFVMKAMKDHIEGKKNLYEVEYRIKTKKGDYKWFHDRGSIVKMGKNGEPLVVKGVVFDITDLKETEKKLIDLNNNLEEIVEKRTEELEKSNKKLKEEIIERKKAEEYSERSKDNLRNVIDSASEMIVAFDMNNRISIWNKTAEKITNYKQIEVLNRGIRKLEVFDDPKKVTDDIRIVCGKKPPEFIDIILKTKDDAKKIIRMSGSEIKSSNNECIGAMFIGKDITKEIDLHKKLLGGNSYLISDKSNQSAINLFVDLTINDFNGLIITRGNPDQIKTQVPDSKNIEIVLIGKEKIKEFKMVSDLIDIKSIIMYFTNNHNKSVVLLDGIHYLLSYFSFKEFIKTLYDVNDIVTKNKSILFIRVDPSTIDSNEFALIENELIVLPSQKTDDIIIEDDIYNIIRFINEQNEKSAIVSVKKVMKNFDITYVTAASRLKSLESKGLIVTKKRGKYRAIFITDKGKRLIHKRKTI